jgi:hypothetical protein
LGSVGLPGVEYSRTRRWLIHGKETTIKDAIPEQIHRARYSPNCKVITVVTVNNSMVVINVLLTFNLQLIYNHTVSDPKWPALVPLHVGFNDSTGLNLFGIYPTEAPRTQHGLIQLFGVSGILISLPEIFQKVRLIEDYFNSTGDRVATLMKDVDNKEASPVCRFGWRPGVMDRNDPAAIELDLGQLSFTTAEDTRRQEEFYNKIFANPQSSMHSTPELRRFFVPHLFSFTYPWVPEQRVSVFAVVMKNEYHIIAIGPASSSPRQASEVIRALYATDIRVSGDAKEYIEIYKSGSNYVLHVFKMEEQMGSYSGAPMPIPVWTILSPHFLEEDAWYDTFVIHRAGHVTMPTGWSQTPNMALVSTTNCYAYFEPCTFVAQDVVDYGHRTHSAYVLPKYLLWKEYGLRGLKAANPNEIFFGDGRYADILGPYLRSIYEDKTYNDSNYLFPTAFATACNVDYISRKTKHVNAFFRRLHQDKNRLLDNSHATSCTLPLACRANPIASLSFMRHIVLYPYKVNDIGSVDIKKGATEPKSEQYGNRWYQWGRRFEEMWYYFKPSGTWINSRDTRTEPNMSLVTLPLPGFCSFRYKLYRAPPISLSFSIQDDPFWEFVQFSAPSPKDDFPRWETYMLKQAAHGSKGPASPFTRLVEEILNMKDRDIQLLFLRVVWLEKLLAWKMQTFGLHIYLTRTALPMLILFCVHLLVAILLTGNGGNDVKHVTGLSIFLVCIEALVSCYILSVKIRQLYRIPRLFVRSTFNYIDGLPLHELHHVFPHCFENCSTSPIFGVFHAVDLGRDYSHAEDIPTYWNVTLAFD